MQTEKRTLLVKKNRMPLACTICMVTCGNGAMTGIMRATIRHRRRVIHPGPLRAPSGCHVAVAGTSVPETAGRHSVTGTTRRARATATASVLSAGPKYKAEGKRHKAKGEKATAEAGILNHDLWD